MHKTLSQRWKMDTTSAKLVSHKRKILCAEQIYTDEPGYVKPWETAPVSLSEINAYLRYRNVRISLCFQHFSPYQPVREASSFIRIPTVSYALTVCAESFLYQPVSVTETEKYPYFPMLSRSFPIWDFPLFLICRTHLTVWPVLLRRVLSLAIRLSLLCAEYRGRNSCSMFISGYTIRRNLMQYRTFLWTTPFRIRNQNRLSYSYPRLIFIQRPFYIFVGLYWIRNCQILSLVFTPFLSRNQAVRIEKVCAG